VFDAAYPRFVEALAAVPMAERNGPVVPEMNKGQARSGIFSADPPN
jgi:hypothetical protein